MPIRIPQIVSQQGLAAQPGPMLDPGSATSLATGPARAFGQAAETISKAFADYQKVKQKLTEKDMELDEQVKLSELKDLLAQEDIKASEEGVEPDALATTMQQRGGQRVQELVGQLKYAESAREFGVKANAVLGTEVIKQRYKGLKRLEARIGINTAIANQDLAVAAVNASTPELRAAAMQGIENNVNDLVKRGIWSQEKGESEILQARTQVVEGRVIRQFDTPGMQTQTITSLRRAEVVGLSAVRQYELADKLENKERAEYQRIKTEKKEADKAVADETDRSITDLIVARKFGEARLALATDAARKIEPARYSTLSTTIETQANLQAPSNPVTLLRLKAATHSIKTNPVEVLNELQQALADGTLTTTDFTPMASHVEARIKAKKEGDPLLGRQHAQAEQNLREALRVTGPAAQSLDAAAQDMLVLGLEDLTRNSAYLGKGDENPLEWYDRRKSFYIARLGTVASQRLRDLNNQLRDGNGVGYATGNLKADTQALMQRRPTFKTDAAFWDQMRILKESADIRNAIQDLQGRSGNFPPAPMPGYQQPPSPSSSPNAPKPPPASGGGGGKTLGRPQGQK